MLKWFDSYPAAYWILAWCSFAVLSGVTFLPAILGLISERWKNESVRMLPPWLFTVAMVISFFAFRWPLWWVAEELNPDESQVIAGAITLLHDPLYWRSVDGTTHGPLDSYVLLVPRLFGLPIDYGSARLIGSILMVLLIHACYRTMLAYGQDALARIVTLSAFCFLAFTTFNDFVHYSSEHVPAAMVTIGFLLLSSDLVRPEGRRVFSARWIVGGVILGAVPLAKLQAAPIAACILATAALIDFRMQGVGVSDRLKRLLVLAGASASVVLIFGLITWKAGVWNDAWQSYIVQNLRYAGDRHYSHADMISQFWTYAQKGVGFYPFAIGCAIICALTALPAIMGQTQSLRLVAMALVFLVASVAAVFAPGRQYEHYLLLLVAPGCLLAGSLWQECWKTAALTPRPRTIRSSLLVLFAAVAIAPQIWARASSSHPYVGRLSDYPRLSNHPVAAIIRAHARRGEPLAIWGWMCRYHVYTKMPQATREAHTSRQIQWTPQMNYFRQRYLDDLKRNFPPVFVDAVGPESFVFQDRSYAHESFEALREFIAANYTQVAESQGCRIYVRLDRLSGL